MTDAGEERWPAVDPLLVPRRAKGESLSLITDALRADILSGKLRPGERIHQEAIAARFGTSRSPAREALKMLQSEGLVVVLPNSGARVPQLDPQELDEVYWLREHVEPAALARSAPYLTDDQLASMERDVELMDGVEPSDPGDSVRFSQIDRRFHFTALSGGASDRLLQFVEGLWNLAEPYRVAYVRLSRAEAIRISQIEHRLILDALRRRSADDAAQLLTVHIRRTRLGLASKSEVFDR